MARCILSRTKRPLVFLVWVGCWIAGSVAAKHPPTLLVLAAAATSTAATAAAATATTVTVTTPTTTPNSDSGTDTGNDSGNDSHNHHDNFNDNFINNDNNNNNNNYHDDTDRLDTLPSPHMQTHPLLQIPCSIQLSATERQTPIHTYVDTGAQVSVLSVQAAGRAGVLQMMDRRYAGHAQGVGKCRVLGRLPAGALMLHLHGQVVVEAPAVTILEHTNDGVDLLLGLDFLRDHGAILNLRTEEMILQLSSSSTSAAATGEVSIPFIRPRATLNFGGTTGQRYGGGDHDKYDSDAREEQNCYQDIRFCRDQDATTDDEEEDEVPTGLDMSGL